MEFAFPWPMTQGEWLAWSAAAFTFFLGLLMLFAPGLTFRLLRLQTTPDHPEAVAGARANMSGFYIGAGLSSIMLAQPLIYLTLGICWSLTAFGRVVSMLSDNGNTIYNWIWLAIEVALAVMVLSFALGFVR